CRRRCAGPDHRLPARHAGTGLRPGRHPRPPARHDAGYAGDDSTLAGCGGGSGWGKRLMDPRTARAAAEAAMRDFKATVENLDRKLDEAIRVCAEEAARLKALAAKRE